ncbi:MAG TPA: beta-L-arabinofuranosidase domain-containing protein, partial [Cytophagaceae bacterium]
TFGDDAGKLDLMKSGHHVGLASGSILEPMVDLYRYTGDAKYLNFCKYIFRAWEQENGPKIMSNLEKFGDVTKVGNAKAYEMLSCMLGIAKFYKLTGEESYYRVLRTAWTNIQSNKLYLTGTTSSFEHFKEDHILPAANDDHMGEGCVTTTWIQFNYQLFTISADSKYMEEMERSVYNHLFAAENPVTGCVSYYTALQGAKPHKCDQGFSCCLSSIPRGISMVPDMVWGKVNGVFSVLMYESGEAIDSIRAADGSSIKVAVKSESKFPFEGKLKYTINPSSAKHFAINFRVPGWCTSFTASVNGKIYKGVAGNFLSVKRKWKPADVIIINLNIPTQIVSGGSSNPKQIAIKRGPQVLAIDLALNPYLTAISTVSCDTNHLILMDAKDLLPIQWSWKQAYSTELKVNGLVEKIILVPFAEAGQYATEIGVWINESKK